MGCRHCGVAPLNSHLFTCPLYQEIAAMPRLVALEDCDEKPNPLQFVRDGVPCDDQEAARKEFIERYGVPVSAGLFTQKEGRALRPLPDNEPGKDMTWEEYGRQLQEAVVKLRNEPVPPTCAAGHKLNSVGKCTCDVTPLGLSAKVVRDALAEVSKASQHKNLSLFWHELAVFAPDDELLKLWRLLR